MRVFISSKREELGDERQVAREAIESFNSEPLMSELREASPSARELARQLDNISYDLLRKLEGRLGMEVHVYLERFREKSFLIKARSYIWFAVFLVLWILAISAP